MRNILLSWLAVALIFTVWLSAGQAYTEFLIKATVPHARDVVFVQEPPNKTCSLAQMTIGCATAVYFNGDWAGVQLCRATKCVRYEEVFK